MRVHPHQGAGGAVLLHTQATVHHRGQPGAPGPVPDRAQATVLFDAQTAVPVSAASTVQVFVLPKFELEPLLLKILPVVFCCFEGVTAELL